MNSFKLRFIAMLSRAAAFVRAKGYYFASFASLLVLGLVVAAAVLLPNNEEQTPVNLSDDERLGDVQSAPLPTPPLSPTPSLSAAPSASPSVTNTPIPDFTQAPQKTTAVKNLLSPPVKGNVIFKFAMDSLLYSKTLDQWTTHSGIDIAAPKGTEVFAVVGGVVQRVYEDDALGVTVEVLNKDTLYIYANLLAEPPVREGERINANTVVGKIGNTAKSECADASHLHFAMVLDGKFIDPEDYVMIYKTEN